MKDYLTLESCPRVYLEPCPSGRSFLGVPETGEEVSPTSPLSSTPLLHRTGRGKRRQEKVVSFAIQWKHPYISGR